MKQPAWLLKVLRRSPPALQKREINIGDLHALVRFSNETDQNILLVIEPWAHEFWIEPSSNVVVMTDRYPIDEASEIEFSEYAVSIYWRLDEVLYVFKNGVRMESFCSEPHR